MNNTGSNELISHAHTAIVEAVRSKQFRSIPAIAAGYINALIGESLAVSTLQKVHQNNLFAKSYYLASPTRIIQVHDDIVRGIPVPEFEIHTRHVLNLEEDIGYESIESLVEGIPVALDRAYISMIKTCARWKMASELDYNYRWTHAIKGNSVSESMLSHAADFVLSDYASLEHRALGDNEFILVDYSNGIPGTVKISAVKQEPLRSSGLAYRINDNRLELAFSVKASIQIFRPDNFVVSSIRT